MEADKWRKGDIVRWFCEKQESFIEIDSPVREGRITGRVIDGNWLKGGSWTSGFPKPYRGSFEFVRRPTDLYLNPAIATEKAKAEAVVKESLIAEDTQKFEKEHLQYRGDAYCNAKLITQSARFLSLVSKADAIDLLNGAIEILEQQKRELSPKKAQWRPKVEGVEPVVGRFV